MGRDKWLTGTVRGRRVRGAAGRLRRRLGPGGPTWPRTRLADVLGVDDHSSVVVLTDPANADRASGWRRQLPGDDVTVLTVGLDVADLDEVLARLTRRRSPHAVLVVLGPQGLARLSRSHRVLFRQLFLYLSAGGSYAVDREVAGPGPVHFLTTLDTPEHDGEDEPTPASGEDRPRWRSLPGTAVTDFVRDVTVVKNVVVVRKRGTHALKIRERQAVDLLPDRAPGTQVDVLQTRPGGRLSVDTTHETYGPGPDEQWPRPLEYPDLGLRHYRGDLVSLRGTRLLAGATVVPESFRYPHSPVLVHPRLKSVTQDFVVVERQPPGEVLQGDFYFIDCLFSGHFGHLTTEVVARLWGWDEARRQVPGLRAFFHTNPDGGRDGSLERRLLTAYGIPESDLTWAPRPVGLRSVVGASPMWHNHERYYVHPDIRETWARLTHGLLDGAEPAGHERIFVSRSARFSHRRGCRNQQEVEGFFADHGFHVFCPEDHTLAEQTAMFAGARVVAGFAGSAMGNLMHARRLEALVVLGHNAYTGRNEHLFAAAWGAQLSYFWQQADVAAPRVGRSRASDRSPFAVDLAGQGADLRRVLAGL